MLLVADGGRFRGGKARGNYLFMSYRGVLWRMVGKEK